MTRRRAAILVLEDGRTFHGEAYGSVGETFGEAVFSSGMSGYQETLTEPAYHRQVLVQTAPHIGNTGVNSEDDGSDRIWVAGYVVREPTRISSNWRATGGLEDRLAAEGVVGICGIDTRALTRHLREQGTMRIGISSRDDDVPALLRRVREAPRLLGADLSAEVTTAEPYTVPADGERRFTVAALDLGLNRALPRRLAARGVTTHVLPASASLDELLAAGADAVFLSPGPGDPAAAEHAVALARDLLRRRVPLFGVGFGHQIVGRALGFGTYQLRHGHHGINQPVRDLATGRIELTRHSHDFAVEAPPQRVVETDFGGVEVSHVCLTDNVVEGLRAREVPAFTVQFHPEGAAGPHDADHLFDRFTALIEGRHA
ncbi:MAG TPA: glutamine-hydrolyzing carbamoyl-phosphate synthase small subunit [Micromonosporaceae bacterium]|nr:glutamine-hydrolyzing carbamoyl-phosphate synthase small subunit [Micromonosporaceae bacterium]